jgi:uncharacterized protein YbjT (DUF2867 family)
MTDRNANSSEPQDLLCDGLPSRPLPGIGRILVTGASGYIGGRLVPELLARGYQVRVMVRVDSPEYRNAWPDAEVVVADALKPEQLDDALDGVDTAYYLIHSLQLGPKEFEAVDMKTAANFRLAAEKNKVRRIIYLGGLGDATVPLSSHLRSRMDVAGQLVSGSVPVTVLRAAIIIGSGSASYEMIQHLVRKLPLIIVPRCTLNRCQPISIRDVIKYLVGVLEVPETAGQSFDIGGNDILCYKEMMDVLARVLNKKTLIVPSSFSWMPLYAYVVSLLTPVPNAITQCLMKGLKNEVVCQTVEIGKFLPFEPISYREALVRAMSREEQDRVYTRWSDAYPPAHELALKLHEIQGEVTYTTTDSLLTPRSAATLFKSACRIGGREGWHHGTWMWRLRGMLDRVLMGVGTSRGRKRHSHLKINDVLDFWRVEDIVPQTRLLLRAEMKLPGRAWLEFNIKPESSQTRLSVTAYFDTRSLFGRLYWLMFTPFHHFIFRHLIEGIEVRS